MTINRREFIVGGMTSAARGRASAVPDAVCRVGFLSDLHLDGRNPGAPQNLAARETVGALLSVMPRVDRVVVCGDLSHSLGLAEDYRLAAEILKPLADAGIGIEVMTGNHDLRAPLCAAFPQAAMSAVPGCVVRTVDLGVAELVLLDSLVENRVDGEVCAEQEKWLLKHLNDADKPVFLCVHHDGRQMKRFASSVLAHSPKIAGYIHGHRHAWIVDALHCWKGAARLVRSVGLPSAGFWGDIGFAVMEFGRRSATLTLHERDCFFPDPSGRCEATGYMRHENDGAQVALAYPDIQRSTVVSEVAAGPDQARGPLRLVFTGTGAVDGNKGGAEDGERRAFSSVLLDGRVLVDWQTSARSNLPDGAAPEALVQTHSHGDHFDPDAVVALVSVRRVYVERGWSDYARTALARAAARRGMRSPDVVAIDLYRPFVAGGLEFRALPANHRTGLKGEQCVIYQIRKRAEDGSDGANLLYATDTGGLMKEAVENIDGTLNALILNAMIGPGHRGNPRLFSHFTAELAAETAEALRKIGKYSPPVGRPVWTTHLSRELNGSQKMLSMSYPAGLIPAFDGLEIILT